MNTPAFFLSLVFLFLPFSVFAQAQENTSSVNVGAYYFDGWTGEKLHLTDRLKNEFANREPVWGWLDNTVDIMQQQIDFAANAGLSFFAFDWYWPEGKNKEIYLNNALELYLKSNNRSRLGFCLLVANHGGFRIGPGDWAAVSVKWIALFKEPGYVKVDGKPLLIFFAPGQLLKKFGTPEAVKAALDQLKQDAVAAGLEGVTVAACTPPWPGGGWQNLNELASAGFDVFTGYNYPAVKKEERQQPFAGLIASHQMIWDKFSQKSPLPYIPVVTTGWDKRPWEKLDLPPEKQAIYYPDRTPQAVGQFVADAIQWGQQHPQNTVKENIVILYAWNENGEGGYLTPTKSEGDVYLQAVAQAIKNSTQ